MPVLPLVLSSVWVQPRGIGWSSYSLSIVQNSSLLSRLQENFSVFPLDVRDDTSFLNMSRAALLLVVGEAFNDKQKTLILDKIADGNSPFIWIYNYIALNFFAESPVYSYLASLQQLPSLLNYWAVCTLYVICIILCDFYAVVSNCLQLPEGSRNNI